MVELAELGRGEGCLFAPFDTFAECKSDVRAGTEIDVGGKSCSSFNREGAALK